MLNDSAKAKLVSALQPFYTDTDFANVFGDFVVTVNTTTEPQTPPPTENEQVDVPKA